MLSMFLPRMMKIQTKNEGARVLTMLNNNFPSAQGQLTWNGLNFFRHLRALLNSEISNGVMARLLHGLVLSQ